VRAAMVVRALRKPDVFSGIQVIVAKQSMPSIERRQKANITDCSEFAIDSLSSDKPWEPAAESLNPGDHFSYVRAIQLSVPPWHMLR